MVPFSMFLNDPNADFKVTPLLDGEYLRNGTRYRHSYKGLTHVLLKCVILQWNTNRD